MRLPHETLESLRERVVRLERSGRRLRLALLASSVVVASALLVSASRIPDDLQVGTLFAERIVVVDHDGRAPVTLGEDQEEVGRRAWAAAMWIHDATGAERGGLCTLSDGSAILGLDAPAGVGAPMRDRIGLVVSPDGSARIDLIDNASRIAVRLVSETDGSGGVEFFEYDTEARECTLTHLDETGSSRNTESLGD